MNDPKPETPSRLSHAGAIAPAPQQPGAQPAPDLATLIARTMTALAERIRQHGRSALR